MRLPARLILTASCASVVFTAACSDSTGPSSADQAARLAAHFDSLYVEANTLSENGTNAYSFRALMMSLIEIGPAFGKLPSTVTVTTANGTEHWKGFEFEDVQTDTGGAPSDSTYILVAYRDSDAHTLMITFYGEDGSIQDGGIIVDDTLNVSGSDGSGNTSRTSLGNACSAPSSSLVNPQITELAQLTCALATFSTTMTMMVPSTPNVDDALTSLSLSAQTFDGQRLVDLQSSGAAVRRVHALVQRMHHANRF